MWKPWVNRKHAPGLDLAGIALAAGLLFASVAAAQSPGSKPPSEPPAGATGPTGAAGATGPSGLVPRDLVVPQPFMRVVESANGRTLELQAVMRELIPDDPGRPIVHLAAAIHVADRAFYQSLQKALDEQDVVLFEQVKPAGAGLHDAERLAAMDDPARARFTERRLRFLGIAAEKYKRAHAAYPADLDELASGVGARLGALVRSSENDAWGSPIAVLPPPTAAAPEPAPLDQPAAPAKPSAARFDLLSLGADGKPGGDGPAKDLRLSAQKRPTSAELGEAEGIQQQLADALGLVFQPKAMNHDAPNWRNSDLSIDEIQDRLERQGDAGTSDALFRLLDGSSFSGRLASVLVRMMGASPTARAMMKLMLIELIPRSEDALANAPGGLGGLMKVLIQDRNAVVIEDLRRIIDDEPKIRSVGIIYGAGHLPAMQERITRELGYHLSEDRWRTAFSLDLDDAGIPPGQVQSIRAMIRQSIEQQFKRDRGGHGP